MLTTVTRQKKRLWLFLAGALIVRLVRSILVYTNDLQVTHDEDLSRYWLSSMAWNYQIPGHEPGYWFEYSPWLPLHLQLLYLLHRTGPLHLLFIYIMQQAASFAATAIAGLLARDLARGSWLAAWLALGILSASPLFNLLSGGLVSEPFFFLSILAMLWGGIRVARGGGRLFAALMWAGVVSAQMNRYEGWALALLVLPVVFLSGPRTVRRAVVYTAGWCAFPFLWMVLHWVYNGSPLAFLGMTEDYFGANTGSANRFALSAGMWVDSWTELVVPMVMAILGLLVFHPLERAVRLTFAFALFYAFLITALTSIGLSAFSYWERFPVTFCVFLAPPLAAWITPKIPGRLYTRVVAGVIAGLVLSGYERTASRESLLRTRYHIEDLRAMYAMVHGKFGVPGNRVAFYIDDNGLKWQVVALQFVHDRCWNLVTVDREVLRRGAADYPHIILANPLGLERTSVIDGTLIMERHLGWQFHALMYRGRATSLPWSRTGVFSIPFRGSPRGDLSLIPGVLENDSMHYG